MEFGLKDYQSDAVAEVLANLADAKDDFHRRGRRTAFSLTSPTASGKTVMAAAVIEALFRGDDAFDFPADPSATIIWFSDDPNLNEQTRFRLLEATDRVPHSSLVPVSNKFNEERFEHGKVYFLNTSKLSKNSLLVRGYRSDSNQDGLFDLDSLHRPDLRYHTIWDTISNTIEDDNLTLYFILDEAHRGLGVRTKAAAEEKATIVTRLINGDNGVPPIPIVWGISATVDRFNKAMKDAVGRTTLPPVLTDSARVQASGLLKDDILLDIPIESGAFDTVLVKRAARKLVESSEAWRKYADEQSGERILPLMVLQAPNTPNFDVLGRALDAIRDEWHGLPTDAVAHVFGEHTTLQFGAYQVAYVKPEKVQETRSIRVLVAKDAISTGWDCPRAEVLVSFRPARDKTHITQLLGRMVRTPLARRIPGNDRLNSVECLLPFFDRETAVSVANILMNTNGGGDDDDDGSGGTGGGSGRRVLIAPRDMTPNESVPDIVWELFETLPTESLPKRGARPVKRLTALAQALSMDGLRPGAGKEVHRELHAVLDGLVARYSDKIAAAIKEVETVEGETIRGTMRTGQVISSPFSEAADDRVIADAFRVASRVLSADLARTYADHLAGPDDGSGEDNLREAHTKIAALGLVPEIKDDLDREADKISGAWFSEHRVTIKGLSDERQAVYIDIQAQSTEPQRISLTQPRIRTEETRDKESNELLRTRPYHLLADETGEFPVAGLNTWEVSVLDSELAQPGLLAWYRNPPRTSYDSLAVAYRDGKGAWRSMRPDFIFFTQNFQGEVKASIVDPHGTHLADCLLKLRGLADFTAKFGDEFHRIEAVAKVKGTLRVLDLTKEPVRQAIAQAVNAEALYMGDDADDY